MARRSDHTRDELKKLMILKAREIVSEKGMAGLSVREIAKRIGYAPGTLYNIFMNLDEIVFHVEAEVLEGLGEKLNSVSYDLEPDQQLYEFTKCYLSYISENQNLWRLVVDFQVPNTLKIPPFYNEKMDKIISLTEKRVMPFYSQDDKEGLRNAAYVFWASLLGLTQLSSNGKLNIVGSDEITMCVDFWLEGYIASLKQQSKNSDSAQNIQKL